MAAGIGRTREDRQRFEAAVLDALPAPGDKPLSTNDLGNRFELGPYERSVLWSLLDKLVRAGLVERVHVDGELCRYWRRRGDSRAG